MSLGQSNRSTYPYLSIGNIIESEQPKRGPCQLHDRETEKAFSGEAGVYESKPPVNLGELLRAKVATITAAAAEKVNHPSHYTKGKVECIDAIDSAVTGLEGVEAAYTANIIKYTYRWKDKGGVEDLRKARWYLDRLIAFKGVSNA
jgi:hypothetical protein